MNVLINRKNDIKNYLSTESQPDKLLPTLQIEVDIFSGRENPKWVLTEQQTKEFLEFSQWHEMIVTEENTQDFEFGFNGFIVTKLSDIGTDLPYRFHLVNTYRPHYHLDNILTKLSIDEMVSREEWLLKTYETPEKYDETFPYLLNFIKKKIVPKEHNETKTSEEQTDDVLKGCPIKKLQWKPSTWNNLPYVKANNNCYNYATNYPSNTFAQPGRKSGHEYTAFTCSNVKAAAISDGMVKISNCVHGTRYYKIALVIAPNTPMDYHWYRKQVNSDGKMWGHKPGSTNVIDTDASDDLITNPETCNRNYSGNGGPNYSDFCGFYYWVVDTPVN